MKKYILTAVAVTAFLPVFAQTAMSADWDDSMKGRSEQEIGQAAGADALETLKQQYQLPDNFTEADFRAAAGAREIKKLRGEYKLAPGFTSDDLRKAMGAETVADYFERYPDLRPNFTIQDLARAKAELELARISQAHPGLSQHFSAAEYITIRGEQEAADLVKTYGLPSNFTYDDMVRIMGPTGAASRRHQEGFAKKASHAEIVRSFGVHYLQWLSEEEELNRVTPANPQSGLSSAEVLSAVTAHELSLILQSYPSLSAQSSDSDLIWVSGERQLDMLRTDLKLPAYFTENDISIAAGERAVEQLDYEYSVDPGFTPADIAKAAADSVIIQERRDYGLRPGFTAEEDGAARKRRGVTRRNPYLDCY